MWNPFRRVRLEPVIPSKDVKPASGPETTDPVYMAEVERAKLRSLLARTQISMIHEQLAQSALCHIRGGNVCPVMASEPTETGSSFPTGSSGHWSCSIDAGSSPYR